MAVVGEKRADGRIVDADCPKCHALISQYDSACLNCGASFPNVPAAPAQHHRPWWHWAVAAFVVLMILGAIGKAVGTSSASTPPAQAASEAQACGTAQIFIKKILKAPTTAKFEPCGQATISRSIDRWTVTIGVDSQNSFAAMIHGTYTVVMDFMGGGSWTLVNLQPSR